jgi:2',3'-cyclic-nucleotide 2'-phosphodiesterase/3'-nucleotidase
LVDAGNFATYRDESWEKARFIWDLMAQLAYDAVTPGDLDMREGADSLMALYATHPQISVVSANILNKDGEPLFPEYTIVNKGNVKVGITGVTEEKYYAKNVTDDKQKIDDFTFKNSKDALVSVIPRIREEADVVVALLQWSDLEARTRLKEIEGIDIAITGQNPSVSVEPIDNTSLVLPGARGRYMAVINLSFDKDKAITERSEEVKKLGEDVPQDTEYEPVITEWGVAFRKSESRRRYLEGLELNKKIKAEREDQNTIPEGAEPSNP